MKLNLLVLTLLMTSLTTDVLPAAKRQASGDESEQEGQPPEKKARTQEEAEICYVCLQRQEDSGRFIPPAEFQQLLPCTHNQVHESCLRESLRRSNRCPLCRAEGLGSPYPLHEAARQGNLAVVQALLGVPGIDINALNQEGYTALHYAAEEGHVLVAQELIAAPGINVNATTIELNDDDEEEDTNTTPLYFAARQGHVAVVQALIDAAANVNTADNDGNTPLHRAVMANHLPVVQALLTTPGINVNLVNINELEDNSYGTPLQIAVARNNLEMVRALLAAHGINVNAQDNTGNTSLKIAVERGHLGALNLLLAAPGINANAVDAHRHTALHNAADSGLLQIVEALIAAGANPNGIDPEVFTPLHHAASRGHVAVIQALLATGTSVNAARAGELSHNGKLHHIRTGGSINRKKLTPLHMAALDNRDLGVRALLTAPEITVNTTIIDLDDEGREQDTGTTALHIAAQESHFAAIGIAQALLTAGANINAADAQGRTPLHEAARLGHLAVVQVLLNAGADRTIRNTAGQTAADIAASPAIRTLIEQYQPAAADGGAAAAAE